MSMRFSQKFVTERAAKSMKRKLKSFCYLILLFVPKKQAEHLIENKFVFLLPEQRAL